MPETTRAPAPRRAAQTVRFAEKQAEIIAAATELLMIRGLKGFTLSDVAEKTGLITQGVGYYFTRKDDLATACIEQTVERLGRVAEAALSEGTAERRIAAFFREHLRLWSRIMTGEEPPMAPLDEIRALNAANYARVVERFVPMFRTLRELFGTPELAWMDRRTRTARTHFVMQVALSVPAWELSGNPQDHERSAERLTDILLGGLASRGRLWQPPDLRVTLQPDEPPAREEEFLRAATRLINEQGYRGASVAKISSHLKVSKGSFYHHNDAKDDVVIGCFERTIEIITRAQLAADSLPADELTRLTAAARALAELQLSDGGSLLRTTAVYALPAGAQPMIGRQWERVVRRFAGMVSDGIADGSIRTVDPFIAGHQVMVAINSAAELPAWLRGLEAGSIADLYVRPLFTGLLSG